MKIKPSATSSATTAYCQARLDGPDGRHLWIDGNGKVTAGNGTLDEPKPNAFSLLHIEDCPGSTPTCRASCYVHGLKANAADTYTLYGHNSATIRAILTDADAAADWSRRVGAWIEANARGGFRWHVSGDVFSMAYAEWVADVCRHSPSVRHWIYTRSLEFVPALAEVSVAAGGNLSLNVSADRDNVEAAMAAAAEHGARVCFMATPGDILPDGLDRGDVIFPDYALRGGTEAGAAWFAALEPASRKMVCPVDYHGKSQVRRCGPCSMCIGPDAAAMVSLAA